MAWRLLIPLLAAAALSGCGGDEQTTAAPAPTPTPPAAATEVPTATPTATPSPTATDAPTPENPEDQPGGAGDEQEARVPVQFTVDSAGVVPPKVAVPAFLAIELIVQNGFGSPIVVRLEGAHPLRVLPYETARVRLEGRRPGRYRIDFGRGLEGVLVTGAEPGP